MYASSFIILIISVGVAAVTLEFSAKDSLDDGDESNSLRTDTNSDLDFGLDPTRTGRCNLYLYCVTVKCF